MNIYRLDHHRRDGSIVHVQDLLGTALIRQRKLADDVARQTVATRGGHVNIVRISGAGHLQCVATVDRDGVHRPQCTEGL